MREKVNRSLPCAFRTDESDGKKIIEGYFAVYNEVYDMGWGVTESIARGAFDKYLKSDVRILVNHDTTLVLGRTKADTATLKSDDRGVYVRCEINEDDVDAMNLYARVKRGDVSQASWGGYIVEETRDVDAKTGNCHYTLTEVEPFEFTVCTFPAYETTEVGARSQNGRTGYERWKKEMEERFKKWH